MGIIVKYKMQTTKFIYLSSFNTLCLVGFSLIFSWSIDNWLVFNPFSIGTDILRLNSRGAVNALDVFFFLKYKHSYKDKTNW